MGSIAGLIDGAALTRLARGDGAIRLGEVGRPSGVCLGAGYGSEGDLPVKMREPSALSDDDADDVAGYAAYADGGGARAVAIALADAAPTRWTYFGAVIADGGGVRAELIGDHAFAIRRWYDRWKLPPVGESAGGAVRLVVHPQQAWQCAVLVDGGGAPVGVYVGFDDGGDAVAIVLDAAGLGGLRDDRDGEESLRAASLALADAAVGPIAIVAPRAHRGFVPNLAEGVPRFAWCSAGSTSTGAARSRGRRPAIAPT